MAVRDDEVNASGQARWGLPWRDVLGNLPAALLLGGLFMYAYLSICYDRFYGRLGVDPNDVGLSYAGTLARSSGFVIVYFLVGVSVLQYVFPFALRARPRRLRLSTHRMRAALVGSTAVMVLVLVWPFLAAGDAAEHVQAGNPVAPAQLPSIPELPFPVPPLPVLAIHADPATVEPAGKPSDSPSVARLRNRRLLYLGQSGGTVVLYDAAVDRAVYVPGSSIILHVAACNAKPLPDPTCSEARNY
jgi:hypothetical protein